jgi:hypothetical protein
MLAGLAGNSGSTAIGQGARRASTIVAQRHVPVKVWIGIRMKDPIGSHVCLMSGIGGCRVRCCSGIIAIHTTRREEIDAAITKNAVGK